MNKSKDKKSSITDEEMLELATQAELIPEQKTKITAFHGVFEDKLKQLIAKIKKVRKDPESKSKVKALVAEAKALKKLIKKDAKESHLHSVQVSLEIIDGKIVLNETCPSSRINLKDSRFVGGLLIVEFDIHPL